MTFKEYSYLICGIIYLIYLVYILFNKLFQDISEEKVMMNPISYLHSILNHPATLFGGIGTIWTILGLFTPLWFLFSLLLLNRLVYLFAPFNRKNDLIQYKITTTIEIIFVAIILIMLFNE